MRIIDCHIHCGVQNTQLPFERIEQILNEAGIGEACLYPPVEDIYYRYSRNFNDDQSWRKCRERAHEYLLEVARKRPGIYPYYFVWNDFRIGELEKNFFGIKWHHHEGEPEYHYDDPRCEEMINAICQKKLPVVLEETFNRTLEFIKRVSGRTVVIIPHLGMLNGGYEMLTSAGIWEEENIYADTALAGPFEIMDFIEKYGSGRLLFGSDYPFGSPGRQLEKLKKMNIPAPDQEKILSLNLLNLFKPL
jgi:hypothetical protein